MVAIFLPECGGGGCSRVEHQRMGTSSVGHGCLVPLLLGCGTMVDRVVRGGDTLLGCEAARSPMTLECFPVGEWFEGFVGCVAGPPWSFLARMRGWGWCGVVS